MEDKTMSTDTETKQALPPLRPDEEALPYSKYYYRPVAPPNQKLIDILDQGPMDPAKALSFDNINSLLDPGYHEVETGYCQLPNGGGYLAVNNVFPGVTVDMIKWWFAWHAPGGGLRYKIWYPPAHASITLDDFDRAKVLDPNVPIGQKSQHVTHWVTENVGLGYEDICINFLDPQTLGFDMSRFHSPNVGWVFGGYGVQELRDDPHPHKGAAIMLHFVREIEGGIEFRTRFWMGHRIVKGRAQCVLPPWIRLPVEAPMGLAYHNVMEYSNLASFLPQIYAEEGPEVRGLA
jgi:phloretin hydrolase